MIWWLTVMGRLPAGGSVNQTTAYFQSISKNIFEDSLPADYPPISVKSYLAMKLLAIPAGGGISRLRDQYSTSLGVLLAIAGFVLLIACANLANLLLARGSARRKEVAVRLAMGASRADLIGQSMTEGLLLAAAGALVGLMVSQMLSRVLVSFLASSDDPTFVDLPLDWRVFTFTAGLCVGTCLLFALAPALRMTRGNAGDALKSSGRSSSAGREGAGLRRVLAASQIALSLALMVGALLFVATLRNLITVDVGFERRGVVIVDVHGGNFPVGGRAISYRREIIEKLRAIPGVQAAAEMTIVPLTGPNVSNRMWIDGSDLAHARVVSRSMIGTGYFHAMKTPMVAGRELEEHDISSFAKVAVVNEEFAKELFGGSNALGKRFWIETTSVEPQMALEVVGIVKDSKY
jgi:predicted permease